MTKCNEKNCCMGYYGNCLDVKITNACNAKCSFCIEKGGYCPNNKPVEDLINATNLMEKYTKVLILGGEPLLYKDLEKYLEGIYLYKSAIYLTTNGSLLNSEKAEMLSKYLAGINISIHDFVDKRNSEIYGINIDFENIISAIKIFNKNKIPVRINCNLVKGHIDTKEKAELMIQFVKYVLNADEIRFNELQDSDDIFVDAKDLFSELTDDPFCDGCEQKLKEYDFNVHVKQTCGCNNKKKKNVVNPEPPKYKTKVLYPNAEISDGWKTKNILEELRECHTVSFEKTRSCHCGSRECH